MLQATYMSHLEQASAGPQECAISRVLGPCVGQRRFGRWESHLPDTGGQSRTEHQRTKLKRPCPACRMRGSRSRKKDHACPMEQ